jgi:hypothetical protein
MTDLAIEVYTAPSRTFVSAIAPQGPGRVDRQLDKLAAHRPQ